MSDHESAGPEFIAVALQVSCNGVNACPDPESARARISETIDTISGYTTTATNFMNWFYGVPVKLVALPEYAVTGFPMKESPAEWREKACFAYDGPEYETLGKLAQDNDIYLAGNVYEVDPNFPGALFPGLLHHRSERRCDSALPPPDLELRADAARCLGQVPRPLRPGRRVPGRAHRNRQPGNDRLRRDAVSGIHPHARDARRGSHHPSRPANPAVRS
jgi:hypothetical protein